jgi:Na+/melibiose symporter-like transporter
MVSYPNHAISLGASGWVRTVWDARIATAWWAHMSRKLLTKRRRKHLERAIHGIAAGLIASAVVILGAIMIVRLNSGRHIGHRVPFGFVLFTTIFILMVYWFERDLKRETGRSTRSVTRGAVTKLSEDQDHTKSA